MNFIRHIITFLLTCCVLLECKKIDFETDFSTGKRSVNEIEKIFVIHPINGFDRHSAQQVATRIKVLFPDVLVGDNVELPKRFFVRERNRYRADSTIRFLMNLHKGDTVSVGLIHRDISTSVRGSNDWGIMGLGYQPGKACVVSEFRLHKKNKTEQLTKVTLHEIGHTQGLPHCAEKTCLMRDAEGKNHLDQQKGFCKKCREFLYKRQTVGK